MHVKLVESTSVQSFKKELTKALNGLKGIKKQVQFSTCPGHNGTIMYSALIIHA